MILRLLFVFIFLVSVSLAIEIKIAENVCFGARGNHSGLFIPSQTISKIQSLKIIHRSGNLSCGVNRPSECPYNAFGSNELCQMHMVLITDQANNIIAPTTYDPGMQWINNPLWYTLDGYYANATELTFRVPEITFHADNQYKLWYSEDRLNVSVDNSYGLSCVDVSANIDPLCMKANYTSPANLNLDVIDTDYILEARTFSAETCVLAQGNPFVTAPDACQPDSVELTIPDPSKPCERDIRCKWNLGKVADCPAVVRRLQGDKIAYDFFAHVLHHTTSQIIADERIPLQIASFHPATVTIPANVSASASVRAVAALDFIQFQKQYAFYDHSAGIYHMVIEIRTNHPWNQDLNLTLVSSPGSVQASEVTILPHTPVCEAEGQCRRTVEIRVKEDMCLLAGDYTFTAPVSCRVGTCPEVAVPEFVVDIQPSGCIINIEKDIAASLYIQNARPAYYFGDAITLIGNLTSNPPLTESRLKELAICKDLGVPCTTANKKTLLVDGSVHSIFGPEFATSYVKETPSRYVIQLALNQAPLQPWMDGGVANVRFDAMFDEFSYVGPVNAQRTRERTISGTASLYAANMAQEERIEEGASARLLVENGAAALSCWMAVLVALLALLLC